MLYILRFVSFNLFITCRYSGPTHLLSRKVECRSSTCSVIQNCQKSVFNQCSSSIGLNVHVICICFCQRRRRSSCSKSLLRNSVASSIHIRLILRILLIFSGLSIHLNTMSDHVRLFLIYIGDLVISKSSESHQSSMIPTSSANTDSLIVT